MWSQVQILPFRPGFIAGIAQLVEHWPSKPEANSSRRFEPGYPLQFSSANGMAQMAELADAPGSGPGAARCGGSSPPLGTINKLERFVGALSTGLELNGL